MANLTGTQKKKRNQFVALIVAIVVVLAAIAFVVFSNYSFAALSNNAFKTVVSEALGTNPAFISKASLGEIKYVEFYNNGTELAVFFGDDEFLTKLSAYEDEQTSIAEAEEAKATEIEEARTAAEEAGEEFNEEEFVPTTVVPEAKLEHPVSTAKSAYGASTTNYEKLGDIKYFTGAKRISIIGAEIDSSTLKGLKNLTNATFESCKFDSLDGFKALDLTKFENITFSNCTGISDWTPVESIADKVTVTTYIPIDLGDGTSQYYPISATLEEMLAAEAEAAEGENGTTEDVSETEISEEETPEGEGSSEDAAIENEAATDENADTIE